MIRSLGVLAAVFLVGCRVAPRPTPSAGLSALEAALRVIPSREQDIRIVLGESAPQSVSGGAEAIAALPSRLSRVRWFPDLKSALAFCADLGAGVQCSRLRVDSISRVDTMHRVFITQFAMAGCGSQEYWVDVLVAASRIEVRAVTVGESGSCGVRAPRPW